MSSIPFNAFAHCIIMFTHARTHALASHHTLHNVIYAECQSEMMNFNEVSVQRMNIVSTMCVRKFDFVFNAHSFDDGTCQTYEPTDIL